jgi:hypothetical protein
VSIRSSRALDGQVLRLVDDQHHVVVLAVLLDHPVLQHLKLGDIGRIHVAGHVERIEHPLQKLAAIAGGIRDQPDVGGGVEHRQQLLQERRLARAHLAGDDGNRRARHHPVFQHREGALVGRGPVQEIRIRQERERPLGKAEMLCEEFRA